MLHAARSSSFSPRPRWGLGLGEAEGLHDPEYGPLPPLTVSEVLALGFERAYKWHVRGRSKGPCTYPKRAWVGPRDMRVCAHKPQTLDPVSGVATS